MNRRKRILTIAISSEQELRLLSAELRRTGQRAKVWLRVSTGGHGLQPDDIWPLTAYIIATPAMDLGGLLSVVRPVEADSQAELLARLAAYCTWRTMPNPHLLLIRIRY